MAKVKQLGQSVMIPIERSNAAANKQVKIKFEVWQKRKKEVIFYSKKVQLQNFPIRNNAQKKSFRYEMMMALAVD